MKYEKRCCITLRKNQYLYEKLSKEHFNKQASIYDQTDTWYYSKEGKISCEDIAAYLKNVSFSSLLDIGCGTGYLIDLLAKMRNAKYCGLDLSDEMIKFAKSKEIPGAEFVVGKSNDLPYQDKFFDIVTCSQSFHHYPYQDKAISEAFRVLKDGGLYILSDTGIGGIGGWIDNHIIFKLIKSGDYRVTNRKGIEKMMIKAGFEILSSWQISRFIYTVVAKK